MIHETFVASDPKTAYEQAIEKYGKDISLVSAKQIKYDDGILRSEVLIAVPEDVFNEKSLGGILEETDGEDNKVLLSEIQELKIQLSQMKEDILSDESESILQKVKNLFTKKGISSIWLDKILADISEKSILEDEVLLVSYLLEKMDDVLNIEEEVLDGPKMIMLVGPTGVGKTTTIAKLAARYAYLMDKPYKVALLNLDSYKVGAFEQLAHYADIMHLEHIAVEGLDNFISSIEKLDKYDIILVDTAGMSPYDTKKFIKTIELVESSLPRKIEINLVLSATVKYEDMDDIYKNFSFLNLHSILFTKFDETKHFGTLLNFMLLYNISMSYFSIGQEVPDDLIIASKEYLLEHFIGDLDEK